MGENGSDKRRVFDNAELAEMMTECGSFHPDEAAVKDSSIDDLDMETVKAFLFSRFSSRFENIGLAEADLKNNLLISWLILLVKALHWKNFLGICVLFVRMEDSP